MTPSTVEALRLSRDVLVSLRRPDAETALAAVTAALEHATREAAIDADLDREREARFLVRGEAQEVAFRHSRCDDCGSTLSMAGTATHECSTSPTVRKVRNLGAFTCECGAFGGFRFLDATGRRVTIHDSHVCAPREALLKDARSQRPAETAPQPTSDFETLLVAYDEAVGDLEGFRPDDFTRKVADRRLVELTENVKKTRDALVEKCGKTSDPFRAEGRALLIEADGVARTRRPLTRLERKLVALLERHGVTR